MNVSNLGGRGQVAFYERYTDVDSHDKDVQGAKASEMPCDIEVAFDPTLLRRVVDQIRTAFNMLDTRLHFRVNARTNNVIVEVVDSKTNVVIRQIPSEEMQKLKKKIEEMTGVFVDVKV